VIDENKVIVLTGTPTSESIHEFWKQCLAKYMVEKIDKEMMELQNKG